MTNPPPAAPGCAAEPEGPAVHLAAQKLRAFRRTRGWSQEVFAAEFHVSRGQVARWELGMQYPRRGAMDTREQRGVCDKADWYLPASGDIEWPAVVPAGTA